MEFNQKKGDLFEVDSSYTLVHCISRDCAMGKGIARIFNRKYPRMQRNLRTIIRENHMIGNFAIMYEGEGGKVINLVTKEKYFHKPTYESLRIALESCKNICIKNNIKKVAMPTIASGLDRLKWSEVSKIIQEVFRGMDIKILVCYK